MLNSIYTKGRQNYGHSNVAHDQECSCLLHHWMSQMYNILSQFAMWRNSEDQFDSCFFFLFICVCVYIFCCFFFLFVYDFYFFLYFRFDDFRGACLKGTESYVKFCFSLWKNCSLNYCNVSKRFMQNACVLMRYGETSLE